MAEHKVDKLQQGSRLQTTTLKVALFECDADNSDVFRWMLTLTVLAMKIMLMVTVMVRTDNN
jgi:hypothetical protein